MAVADIINKFITCPDTIFTKTVLHEHFPSNSCCSWLASQVFSIEHWILLDSCFIKPLVAHLETVGIHRYRRNLRRPPEGVEWVTLRMSSVSATIVFYKSFQLLSCECKSDSSRTSRKDISAYQAKIYYVGMTKFTKSGVEAEGWDALLLSLRSVKPATAKEFWKLLFLFPGAALVTTLTREATGELLNVSYLPESSAGRSRKKRNTVRS